MLLFKDLKEYNKQYKPIPSEALQNHELPLLRRVFNPTEHPFESKWTSKWNKHVDGLAANSKVVSVLQNMYEYDVMEATFKTFLFELVSQIDESSPLITVDAINLQGLQFECDDKINLLRGLSALEQCLLIAMKHHSEIYDRDPFNFEMILTRYNKFANSSTTMQGIDRSVILKAYEHIKNLELIAPVSGSASKVQKEYQLHRLLLTYGQISQAVGKTPNLPTEICQWAQSSLV